MPKTKGYSGGRTPKKSKTSSRGKGRGSYGFETKSKKGLSSGHGSYGISSASKRGLGGRHGSNGI